MARHCPQQTRLAVLRLRPRRPGSGQFSHCEAGVRPPPGRFPLRRMMVGFCEVSADATQASLRRDDQDETLTQIVALYFATIVRCSRLPPDQHGAHDHGHGSYPFSNPSPKDSSRAARFLTGDIACILLCFHAGSGCAAHCLASSDLQADGLVSATAAHPPSTHRSTRVTRRMPGSEPGRVGEYGRTL